jgi:hypothetical protein
MKILVIIPVMAHNRSLLRNGVFELFSIRFTEQFCAVCCNYVISLLRVISAICRAHFHQNINQERDEGVHRQSFLILKDKILFDISQNLLAVVVIVP